jgi:radical SAM superfamily enzyme YgiQ (UPF0313 family)
MDKGITFAQIDDFFNGIEPDLPIGAYMMIGFPGESCDEADRGFKYINSLVAEKKLASFVYSQFSVKPGSAIWKDPEAFGISGMQKRKDQDLDHNIYRFISDGMPLETIYTRLSDFSGKTSLERTFSKINAVKFQDIDELLNFSIRDITDFVNSDTGFFYKTMREWLSSPATLSRSEIITW